MEIILPDIGYIDLNPENGDCELIITNIKHYNDEKKMNEIWDTLIHHKYLFCRVTEKLALDLAGDFAAMYAGYNIDTRSRYVIEAKNAGIPDHIIYGHTKGNIK